MKTLAFAALILALQPWLAATQTSSSPVMIGYTGFYMLPFLDGGVLEFEVGEGVWAMAPEKAVKLTLIAPEGRSTLIALEPGRPLLLKEFSEEDPVGEWALVAEGGERVILRLRNPWRGEVKLRYEVSGGRFVATLVGSERAVFLSERGGKKLLVAGIEQALPIELEGSAEKEVIADLLYPGALSYRGVAEGSNYTLEAEPLAARMVGRISGERLKLKAPALHEVGAGGVIPVRMGSALLRLTAASTFGEEKVYVLDEVFASFAGASVERKVKIPLESALNATLTLLLPDPENPRRALRVLELRAPVGVVRFYDPRHGMYVGNLSITSTNLPSAVAGDMAYFALTTEEQVYPVLSKRSGVAGDDVTVYVNGFRAESMRLALKEGEISEEELKLRMLSVVVLGPEEEPLQDVELRVNGRKLSLEMGRGSYLLPAGSYLLEARAGELQGALEVRLEEDVRVVLRLSRPITLDDVLKALAAAEMAGVAVLAFLNVRAIRVFRAGRRSVG